MCIEAPSSAADHAAAAADHADAAAATAANVPSVIADLRRWE